MRWQLALFSFRGRLNRQGFWLGFGINFLFLLLFANLVFDPTAFTVFTALPLLLSGYSLAAVITKRLHDRNRSAKALLMLLVPCVCYLSSLAAQGAMAWLLGVLMPVFIGTMLFLEWGVFAGDPRPNRYGERGLSFTLR